MMSGIMGICVAAFGVIWTILAASMGGGIFALFGIVFIAIAVVQVVYNFKNATSDNRYSVFDITEDGEETDPLQQRFGGSCEDDFQNDSRPESSESLFCPYCGAKAGSGFDFCNKCGRRLP